MARRKLENNHIRKITKTGRHSLGVTLPIAQLRELGWRERQKLVVEFDKQRKRFIIKDWKE